jgi:hypothetical protein
VRGGGSIVDGEFQVGEHDIHFKARAPHAGWMTVQAGLLTCGSMLRSAFPGKTPVALMEGSSPPTVAGAVADLASR